MLVKNEIPILEYDTEKRAVLEPNIEKRYSFPKKAIFLFLQDEVEDFAIANNGQQIGEYETITKSYPVFKINYKGQGICMCRAPLGASASTQLLEFLIGCGVEEVISAGSCGALIGYDENEFLIHIEALRDEGTSYHYLPPERTILLNHTAIQAIEKALDVNNIMFHHCKTWTTDGFYRETVEMVNYRKNEGCQVVEMECAALAACAKFRGITFGQILFTADSLVDVDNYDKREWGASSHLLSLKIALDAVCYL